MSGKNTTDDETSSADLEFGDDKILLVMEDAHVDKKNIYVHEKDTVFNHELSENIHFAN